MADKEAPTEADIDAMPPGKVYRGLSEYGVNGDDLSPAEAKTALKQKIRELTEEAEKARSPEQVAEMMASVAELESYRARRELLLQRCQDIIAYLPSLHQSDREKLSMRFRRDVMKILREIQEHLSKDDCRILVAGETSAGKSTFLNLLLGENILPVAHLSSTSTICELKYGETRQAVVHLREPDPVTESHQVTLTLSADPKQCREQLKPYIHLKTTQRETIPPVSKIEIFLPLAFLKGGVTIVDSPGVGESDMMDDIIAKCIPSAFAFIYIIDSSNAGGVQQDRLGCLLRKCKEHGARSELGQLDKTKAIFVCNKWDLVPEDEREEVKEKIIRNLGEMWNGLEVSLVFTHSNKDAIKSGFRSANLKKLLDGIYELMAQSLHHKLAVQYRRMVGILEQALTYARLALNDAFRNLDKDERYRACVRARQAMSQFDETTARDIKELKDFLDDVTKSAVTIMTEISRNMTDKDAMEEMTLETIHCLLGKEQLKDHVKVANEQFKAKLKEVVTRVEREHDRAIRPVTGQRCHLVSGSDSPLDLISLLSQFLYITVSPLIYVFKGLTPEMKEILPNFLGGNRDLSISSEPAITSMATDEQLKAIADQILRSSFELLNDFKSELQAIKDVDRRLVQERFAETSGQVGLVSLYQPQEAQIALLLGRLAMVELTEMRVYEFDLDSIMGWQDQQNRIGGGSYGEVYRVQVKRDGAPVRAALKVGVRPFDITTEENAWDFLMEVDNLRKLQGEHIVEYYGTACRRERGGLRLGLVMELCEGTLEDRIIGQTEHNPARWGRDPVIKQRAFSYTQNLAVQLCEGLKHIHGEGYIHRDLKFINILVTAGDVVKLADVGVTKRDVDVTGTIIGAPLYMAPEVKERKVYDKSADIYSLGLILWEMWYGRTIWDALQDGSLRAPIDSVSMTMPDSPDSVRPILEWETLVRDCVNLDARRRPSALECLQRIRSMTMEDRTRTSATFRRRPRRLRGPRFQP